MFSTLFSTQAKRVRWLLGSVGGLTTLTVIFFAARTTLVESSGAGGVLGLFFALASLLLLGAHAIWRRKHKGTVRLVMAGLVCGLLALGTSAAFARANRTEAAEVATSDTTYSAGERESRVEKANARAQNAAWLGFLGILPALGALFGLVLAIGDRRELMPLVSSKATSATGKVTPNPSASSALVSSDPAPIALNAIWATLFLGLILLVVAIVWSVGALR